MSVGEIVRRRLRGDFVTDPWGLDPELYAAAMRLGRMRWRIDAQGLEHIPDEGPALLIVQRHIGVSEQAIVSTAISAYTHRRPRNVGVPAMGIFEAPLRKLGAALAHPDEISGLLRDGHLVSLALAPAFFEERPGSVEARLVAPALQSGAPVLPVATHGIEWGRRWRVVIDGPLPTPTMRGHLAAVELAEGAREAVHQIQVLEHRDAVR